MSEQRIMYADCGREFAFTAAERRFFPEKGYDPPKRCKQCRRSKKEQRGGDDRGDRR